MKEKYYYFEGIHKKVPRLIYGTGSPLVKRDMGYAFEGFDMAWENGFRIFDTAHTYGNAEKYLGEWMAQRGHRENIVLVDKGCNPGQYGCDDIFSAETIREQVKESQEKLQTDFFDFYLLHRDDETKPVDEIVEVLNELKDAGCFYYFGVSNWKKERIMEANTYAKEHGLVGFSAISPSFSLAELANDIFGGGVTISGDENQEFRNWLEENQLPVFNYSSLARGYLSGRFDPRNGLRIEDCLAETPIREYDSPVNRERLVRAFEMAEKKDCTMTQLGLAWVLCQKMNLFPIIAPTSDAHMKANMEAFDIVLTDEECKWLETGK